MARSSRTRETRKAGVRRAGNGERSQLDRRRFLQGSLAAGAATGLGVGLAPRFVRRAHADNGPRYLIVLGCFGGASMMDSFMPVDLSEALVHEQRGTVVSHPTYTPSGSNIRCVDRSRPRSFLESHKDDMVVMGAQASSVNHFVAQARAINGRDVFRGRTMTEAVASVYGSAMALPNVNMGRGGYSEPGADAALEARYRAEIVNNPVVWPLSTSGHAGVLPLGDLASQDPAIREAMIQRTRALRDGTLEQASGFGQTFPTSRKRREMLHARSAIEPTLEAADLMQQLLYVRDLGEIFPLSQYGLTASSEADRINDALPGSFPVSNTGRPDDRLDAQAALAYLLIRTGTSCAVTLTEPGTDGFLAFDQSHQNHRGGQATHWDRVLRVADRLIGLLSTAEYIDPDGPTGTSLWDRTMIVFSTEFGRDKWDTGGTFGTGHHLNNGLLAVSPLLRGNQTLGAPDPDNGFICGFDPVTGDPTPFQGLPPGTDPLFTDPMLPPGEDVTFGALLDVLGVGFDGQETLPVIRFRPH